MKIHTKNRRRIRPIHKRIALHASSLLLLLGGGFIPLPVQGFGQAQTIDVSAKVPAPLPTEPAVITSPHDGDHVGIPTITITGTCPANTYVKVLVSGQVAGISQCVGGEFSVQVTLSPGANSIQAQVYNFTDDAGPSSPPITVYYDVPVTSAPGGTSGSSGGRASPAAPPGAGGGGLTIDIPYVFTVKTTHEVWEWNVLISGGVEPFRITVDWGDGTVEHITRADRSLFTISHAYNRQGTYQPLISVRDAAGHGASLQLAAEVREKPTPIVQFVNSIFGDPSPWLLWPIYILILALIGLFWGIEIRNFKRHMQHRRRMRQHHA